ncbi:MAG TPA: hypothetical protein VGS02_11160 [Acidobacteriaceae bacterium]|nr:hypothetical protein [Acidobacteriaceae bacterium]
MACYLQPSEYQTYGLAPDVTDDWIAAASSLMDAHCRRISLNPTQYMERIRMVEGSQTVRLSYLPLVAVAPATLPFVSIRARYGDTRRGHRPHVWLDEVATAFSLPGAWTSVDPSTMDFVAQTGELIFPVNILGLSFNEVEVTYTAGLAALPDAVKCACAQIVKNAQATPGLNVKSSRVDSLQLQYFSGSLVDATVQAMLKPWVAVRMG